MVNNYGPAASTNKSTRPNTHAAAPHRHTRRLPNNTTNDRCACMSPRALGQVKRAYRRLGGSRANGNGLPVQSQRRVAMSISVSPGQSQNRPVGELKQRA
jgi:hypothetical protein